MLGEVVPESVSWASVPDLDPKTFPVYCLICKLIFVCQFLSNLITSKMFDYVGVWPSLWGRFCLFQLRGRDPYIGLAGDISY